jgi:hypothetical protein
MQRRWGNKRNAPPQHKVFILVYKYFQDCLAEIQGGKAGRLQSAAFQGELLLKFIQGYAFNRIQQFLMKDCYCRLLSIRKTAPDIKNIIKTVPRF